MPGDKNWTWTGAWEQPANLRVSRAAGNEAALVFEGTGVAVLGILGQDGGRADVYLDGKLHSIAADAWVPERTYDNDLWRVLGLKPGKHEVRFVTRADADQRSQGRRLSLGKVVVYR